jgi:hypothetical protein
VCQTLIDGRDVHGIGGLGHDLLDVVEEETAMERIGPVGKEIFSREWMDAVGGDVGEVGIGGVWLDAEDEGGTEVGVVI